MSTTVQNDSVALGTDTTGNYMTDLTAGEGIDISHTASEGSTATISAELATETNAGVATFDGTDFTVSAGDVTINAERIQDITGAMFSGNTETGIAVSYEDSDGTIDLVLVDENIQDIAGAMFTGNTETGITATYQDADGTIDLAVSLASFDTDSLSEGSSNLYTQQKEYKM